MTIDEARARVAALDPRAMVTVSPDVPDALLHVSINSEFAVDAYTDEIPDETFNQFIEVIASRLEVASRMVRRIKVGS